jgi:uncharacterized SAM-binding protein YcdF (DUF218 family)
MDYENETSQEKTDELGLPEELEKKRKVPGFSIWKWLFFLLFIIYFVLSYYRIPLLIKLGGYLIVEHEAKKADLIVCLAGKDVERGLAVVDAYKKGLAPYIFRAKKAKPDGFDYLNERVRNYPVGFDLFTLLIEGFGIPKKVILSTDDRVDSTIDEARVVRKFVLDKGYKSVIVITSLTHSRRAWLTFKKIFKDDDIRIISLPSHYQLFNTKDWWTKRKYTRALILEYQKLIYYQIAYLI